MGAKPKKRQLEIAGTTPDAIEELEELAAPYTEALYKRQELQEEENDLRTQLATRMEALGLDAYVYRDGPYRYTFTRAMQAKLKTKREKEPDVEIVEDATEPVN